MSHLHRPALCYVGDCLRVPAYVAPRSGLFACATHGGGRGLPRLPYGVGLADRQPCSACGSMVRRRRALFRDPHAVRECGACRGLRAVVKTPCQSTWYDALWTDADRELSRLSDLAWGVAPSGEHLEQIAALTESGADCGPSTWLVVDRYGCAWGVPSQGGWS